MHLDLDIDSTLKYKSNSQKVRFLTEEWAHRNVLSNHLKLTWNFLP